MSDWIIDRLREVAPTAIPSGMRTINTTWIYFRQPRALLHKVSHGLVDIYLRDIDPEALESCNRRIANNDLPDGFAPGIDTSGNDVLRCAVHGRLVVGELWNGDRPDHEEELLTGVHACARAIDWLGQ